MEYGSIIYYLALLIIVGCLAEIYTRQKGLAVQVQKDRYGNTIPYKARLGPPLLLLITAIIIAVMTA